MHADVGVGADEHAEVAVEGVQPADALLRLEASSYRAVAILVSTRRTRGPGRNFARSCAHADRTRAGTAAAVRGGEGLVQVEVHDVDAEVAGPGDAEDGVEVGAVVVDQPARLVDGRDDLLDVLVPEAERVRVGDHQPGGVGADRRAQRVEIAVAARIGRDGDHLEAGHHRRGRVGAVGASRGPGSWCAPVSPRARC